MKYKKGGISMLNKRSLFFVLVGILLGLFICPLYAQNAQTNDTLKIAELEKENTELKLQLEKVKIENTELKTKLLLVDYEHLNLKLKGDIIKWLTGIVIFIIAVLSGLVWYLIKKEVIDRVKTKIAGGKKEFDEAVQKVESSQREIEATKKEMRVIQYNQIHSILAAYTISDELAKPLPPELVLQILGKAKSDEVFTIANAIYVLGFQKYQDVVPEISKYLNSDCEFLKIVIEALGRIGTQEACERIIDFLENLFEKLQDDSLSIIDRNVLLDQTRESILTLGEMRRPEAIPVLAKAALEYGDFRANGFVAIYKIRGERAKVALNKILESITDIPNFREEIRNILPEAAEHIEEWDVQNAGQR